MKVIVLRSHQKACIEEIDNDLASYQKLVGGYIEIIAPFSDGVVFVCNEEGKLKGLPLNRAIRDEDGNVLDIIAGIAFLCDGSGEDLKGLDEHQLEAYLAQFLFPEEFAMIDGEIVAFQIVCYWGLLGCKRNHLALLLFVQAFARMRDKDTNPNEGKESGVSQKVSRPNFRANLFCRCEKCKRKGTHKPPLSTRFLCS